MTGIAEFLFPHIWKCLPQGLRIRLSDAWVNAQQRSLLGLPRNEVRVVEGAIDLGHPLPSCSLICTCFNESESIVQLLDSIVHQQHPPTEVVICDGGSTDGTVEVIQNWARAFSQNQGKPPFALFVEKGEDLSIAAGRNRAIRLSKHDIILCADAGSTLDKHWVVRLLTPFAQEPKTEVAMGFYKAICRSSFQHALNHFLVPHLETLDPEIFLPSARSLAFRREIFDAVGGYPEHLSHAGEDSLFDVYLKTAARNIVFVPEAISFWHFPKHLEKMARTIIGYAAGDAEGGRVSWAYYVGVGLHYAKLAFEITLLIVLLALAGYLDSSLLGWLAFATTLLILLRVASFLLAYKPLSGRIASLGDMLLRVPALSLMTLCQAWGFLVGLRSRGEAERRRILAAERGHLLMMVQEAAVFEGLGSELSQRLAEGWYITLVYAEYPKEKDAKLFEHPRLEQHLRREFNHWLWKDKHERFLTEGREFSIVDFVNDSFSKELAAKFSDVGVSAADTASK